MRLEHEKKKAQGKFCLFFLKQDMIDQLQRLAHGMGVPASRIVRWGIAHELSLHSNKMADAAAPKPTATVSEFILGQNVLEAENE